MKSVTSSDGTEIAYESDGDGPPVVLVHGGTGCRRHWDALVPHLVDSFTVVRYDRRGRGDSGDADAYGLEREVQDLAAVVETVDGAPTVVGHSFGGLVALAAGAHPEIERLVSYEPALLVDDHRDDDLADRMQERIDDGQRRDAMRLFYEESSGMADVTRMPWWPEEVPFQRLETVVRENRAIESVGLADLPEPTAPVTLLTGEHGPDHLRDAVFALDDRLPDSRIVELDGVGHVATQEAPGRVAAAIAETVPNASDPPAGSDSV